MTKFDPNYVVHPGAVLASFLNETGLSARAAMKVAALHGMSKDEFNGVLDGSMEITYDIARVLERLTFVSPAFWLALEHNFRVGLAAGKLWM